MTQASAILRFAGKVAARDLTRAVYSGLLERDPDEVGVDGYYRLLEHGGNLAEVIKCISSSTEFRERFMRQCAGDLLHAVYQGLLQRAPTAEELTGAISSSADLSELLRTLGASEEHWQGQLALKAAGLAHDLADRLQAKMRGGGAEAPATVAGGGAVDGMVHWLSTVTQTDEYGEALFRRRAASVVNEIYLALLQRAADPGGLAQYTADLATPSNIGSVVKNLAESEEHWHTLLRIHAEQLVRLCFQQLLHRDPSTQELAEGVGGLSTAAALAELLRSLDASEEHWGRQLERNAADLADEITDKLRIGVDSPASDAPVSLASCASNAIAQRIAALIHSEEYADALFRRRAALVVDDVHSALVRRTADPDVLARYTVELKGPSSIGPLVKKIANSEDHWHAVLQDHGEQLVRVLFQHLLNRDPNSQELTEQIGTLSTTDDLGGLLRTLGTSEEHWKAQLDQNGIELADEIANGLKSDVGPGDIDPPAAIPGSPLDRVIGRIRAVTRSDDFSQSLFRRHAASVVNEIYLALLQRCADPGGLTQYTADLVTPSDIGPVVRNLAESEEHWHNMLRGHADQLVRLCFTKLLHRDPSTQELAERTAALSTTAALGELLTALGTSEEQWRGQFERNAVDLTDEIISKLRVGANGHGTAIPVGLASGPADEIVRQIEALTQSEEYGETVFRQHAVSVVNDVYLALLNRPTDPEGLAIYTPELTGASSVGPFVNKIANSVEHWHSLLRSHGEQLVRLLFQHLLNRDPNSRELTEQIGTLATTDDLGRLLRTLGTSEEHWKAQLDQNGAELGNEITNELMSDVQTGDIDPPAEVPGSPVARVIRRIKALIRSDVYGPILFRRHAASIVNEIYLALLNRAADPDGLALYTEQVTTPAAMGSVVKNVADSEEYRQRLLHSHNSELVAAAHQSLLQRPATPEELASYGDQGIITVLKSLAQSDELWQLQLRRRAPALASGVPGLIAGLHSAFSVREPSAAELELLTAALESPEDVQKLVGRLLSAALEADRVTVTAPVVVSVTDLPRVSFLKDWKTAVPTLTLVEGFHPLEGGFAWGSASASLLVTGQTNIYLSCNYLTPGQSQRVTIDADGACQTVTLDDAYSCLEIQIGANQPQLVRFKADGEWNPSSAGSGPDSRNLAFQLWPSVPANVYIANSTETEPQPSPHLIYCVFDSKKEEDTLEPLHARLISRGSPAVLLNPKAAIDKVRRSGLTHGIFLIASSGAYARLFNAGCRGRFIYAEHGTSPLKAYTYNKHYRRYDLILLPGQLWVDRLSQLYPELSSRTHAVGYAKLKDSRAFSPEERTATCKRLHLNPNKRIALFAPSWSGGDRDCGIFNLKHFAHSDALFTIPHDGDRQFVNEFKDSGYVVHSLSQGESISDYYPLADVLVSDISSTAIEFSALGKPVVCIAMERIPDFDMNFREARGRIRIPHTNVHWDFFPTVAPGQLNNALTNLLSAKPRRSMRYQQPRREKSISASVSSLISAHGTTAADLGVDAILKFLNVAPESPELRSHG